MSELLIKADDLSKKFKDFIAVDNISFEIKRGECFGFLGPNGAGKTTTVKMIHCVSPITSGKIIVDGMPASVDNRAIRKITGVIPQENNLDVDLTVYENLLIFADFFDIPKSIAKERIKELLDFVELDKKLNSKVDELSTGMKRRLLVARALINKPKIIIADEPTTGLDPQARHLIWQRLRQLKNQGTTLVLTTQYMEEAEQLCDRLVVMYKGKILKAGLPSQLINDEIGKEVLEIRIPQDQDGMILKNLSGMEFGYERVGDTLYIYCKDGRALVQKVYKLNLPNVLHRPASLEDVFLKLTGRGLIE
ncbi:ATP-binding cassette domain-containing protein [Candidatus Saganbacteria bacterium]|nr:ATP-binding cassette domain-containing protein [Candidatus Saganbacteria bacterium]